MLKCTNTLSLPGSLILNRVRLFLPAVLIVQCVAYTCNLEIPLVTFSRQKLHITLTYRVDVLPTRGCYIENSTHGHYYISVVHSYIFLFSTWL